MLDRVASVRLPLQETVTATSQAAAPFCIPPAVREVPLQLSVPVSVPGLGYRQVCSGVSCFHQHPSVALPTISCLLTSLGQSGLLCLVHAPCRAEGCRRHWTHQSGLRALHAVETREGKFVFKREVLPFLSEQTGTLASLEVSVTVCHFYSDGPFKISVCAKVGFVLALGGLF